MEEAKYFAIDIGGSYIKYARVSRSGTIIEGNKVKTPKSLEELKAVLVEIINGVKEKITGVGISSPGRIDTENGVIYNGGALQFLHEFAIRQFVEDTFSIPCAICNDGKAAALAELWLGNLVDVENGAAIVLGTGVGGGLIANGRILQGSHFQAGELSFMLRSTESVQTSNIIGWSASAIRFVKEAATIIGLEDKSDGKAVFEHLEKKENPELQARFEEYCREIVFIIMNLQATLDISKVVIGGGISVQPLVVQTIAEQYAAVRDTSSFIKSSFAAVDIEACRFGNEANLLGAIYQLFLQINEEEEVQ